MAQAYTPGLKRREFSVIKKTRRLPVPGEVLTRVGDTISHDQVVAKTELLGNPQVVNVALVLDCSEPKDLLKYMLKREGELVRRGELIALNRGWFTKLLGREGRKYFSEFDGTIEYISSSAGQVIIREPPVPMKLTAYVPGVVVEVMPRVGVVIECLASHIQGIFGVGGENHGELMMIAESPDDILSVEKITSQCSGKVLVGGSLVTGDALSRAVDVGVKGIVVGGIKRRDLAGFLGYELGVAITGHEDLGLTLILTEGFGGMPMAKKTFELLKKMEGKLACINGATQIRAGVMRPEIIVPLGDLNREGLFKFGEPDFLTEGMIPGTSVRVIGDLYFGALGRVISLPVELQRVETESHVRVLEVELEDGRHITIPRANVEIIEE